MFFFSFNMTSGQLYLPDIYVPLVLFIYFNVWKFGVGMILKDISYTNHSCIYLIKNTVKTVILWNIITI